MHIACKIAALAVFKSFKGDLWKATS